MHSRIILVMLAAMWLLPPELALANADSAETDVCALLPWDANITYQVNRWGDDTWHTASAVTSDALLPITLGLPVGLYLYGHVKPHYYTSQYEYRYVSETGLQAFTAELLTYGLALGIKALTNRDRPYVRYTPCIHGYQQPFGTSMPSGHAAGSAALATTLSIRYPKWYVITPSVLYALVTGFSRLHLGVHYLTDVLAGYALGIGVAVGVNALNKQLFELADPILPSDEYTIAAMPQFPIFAFSIAF